MNCLSSYYVIMYLGVYASRASDLLPGFLRKGPEFARGLFDAWLVVYVTWICQSDKATVKHELQE